MFCIISDLEPMAVATEVDAEVCVLDIESSDGGGDPYILLEPPTLLLSSAGL
jgi:hypothetical protein